MTAVGQVQTIGTAILSFRTWGYSGRNPTKADHRTLNFSYRGYCCRGQ